MSFFLSTQPMTDATVEIKSEQQTVFCAGNWRLNSTQALSHRLPCLDFPDKQALQLDTGGITAMDSAGALLLSQLIELLESKNNQIETVHMADKHRQLLSLVHQHIENKQVDEKPRKIPGFLYRLGKEAHYKAMQCDGFIILLGELVTRFMQELVHWRRLRWRNIFKVIDLSGLKALPIVGLLSFLIGLVLAYQMGLQLQTYGANIYIAYLTGMANLREFAPLITAIIVAGRSSSSFTAELGSMKVNEEIDALKTMGVSPVELLVLPKVIGMFIAFPLLVFWADLFATFGSMIMSKVMLQVDFYEYLQQLQDKIGSKQYILGLIKAPVFALLIAIVGCFQGLQVKDSADSVGLFTTKSVVQAIFLIIIADALFSIVYSKLGV